MSTKRAEPLVLGRGLRSEIIRVTVDGVPLHDAHVLAAPSALVTTQVGVGWPTSSGGDLGGAATKNVGSLMEEVVRVGLLKRQWLKGWNGDRLIHLGVRQTLI